MANPSRGTEDGHQCETICVSIGVGVYVSRPKPKLEMNPSFDEPIDAGDLSDPNDSMGGFQLAQASAPPPTPHDCVPAKLTLRFSSRSTTTSYHPGDCGSLKGCNSVNTIVLGKDSIDRYKAKTAPA